MNPLHRAAERLHAGHWRTARTAARWARTRPLHAAGAAALGAPAAWQAATANPRILAALPAAWLWASWRTPTAPTCDDSGGEGQPESGGVVHKTDIPDGSTTIKTTMGTAIMTPDPHQQNRTNVTFKP